MASHMKTTVHIPDALLAAAQAIAALEKTTLKALVSEGLQKVVQDRGAAKPYKLKDCSFPPPGEPGEKVRPKDWREIVSLVYGDRGG
jgi:hypothetical protein